MALRILAILCLLLPAFRGIVIATDGHDTRHAGSMIACCEIITTTTCCGLEMVEMVCSSSNGECTCISDPTDLPKPTPTPVLPIAISDLISEVSQTIEIVVWTTDYDRSLESTLAQSGVIASSTHNQIQAALGVWQI